MIKQLQMWVSSLAVRYSIGLWIAAFLLPDLLRHRSTVSTWLGAYSTTYFLLVVICIVFTMLWLLVFVLRQRVQRWLERQPTGLLHAGMGAALVIGAGIWLLNGEVLPKTFIALSMWGFIVVLAYARPDYELVSRRWLWACVLSVVILLIPLIIQNIAVYTHTPDEAFWADYASTLWQRGGLYSRTWAGEPMLIKPGVGWSVGMYGFLLQYVAFDIRIGRLWIVCFTLLCIGLVGLLSRRLYNSTVAMLAMVVAALSMTFFPYSDFRPDYLISLVAPFAAWCLLRGRDAATTPRRVMWAALCGFCVTQSLNLHAVGVVIAVAFALFIGLEALRAAVMTKRVDMLETGGFVIGALLGTGLYYATNIVPVGGLSAFVGELVRERFSAKSLYRSSSLEWPSQLEYFFMLAGYAYLVWRHNRSDRFLLAIGALLVGVGLVLDTQKYITPYRTWHMIPIGVLLAEATRHAHLRVGYNARTALISSACVIFFVAALVGEGIQWRSVGEVIRTGEFPVYPTVVLAEKFEADIAPADVLVSTHEFIWTFHALENFYSVGAEKQLMARYMLTDPQAAWDRIAPTVVIHLLNQMEITPGLQAYMEAHDFQHCQSYRAGGLTADLYRAVC